MSFPDVALLSPALGEAPARDGAALASLGAGGLRRALRGAGLGVCEFDSAAGVMQWSEEGADLLGIAPGAPPTLESFLAGVHPDDRAALRCALLQPPCRLVHEFRVAALAADGGDWRCLEGAADGVDGRFTGVLRDVSEQVRLRAALRTQADALGTRDRRRIEFFVMLAHELRNPLAALDGAAAALAVGDREGHAWATDVITRQVRFLSRLTDDLLDVSRLATGKIELRREMVHVPTVLAQAAEALGPQLARQRHALHVECRAAEALWLAADATRLLQIVTNLLANAVKYTEPGGQIWLEAWADAEAVIRVRDTGVGVEPARLPEIFNLFVQERRSQSHADGGLGIGLSIVQKLAELHGGRVEAHSEGIGRGCTFTVRLPFVAVAAGHDGDGKDGSLPLDGKPAVASTHRARRVLVVDDHPDAAQSLGRLLRVSGHTVEIAGDGAAALAAAEAFRPEVALLDLDLPGGMDGHELAVRLRATEAGRACRLIAVSGYGEAEDRRRAERAGIGHFLVKPVAIAHLRELLAADGAAEAVAPETRADFGDPLVPL